MKVTCSVEVTCGLEARWKWPLAGMPVRILQIRHKSKKVPLFGALRDKIKFIASDFDEPSEDFAEYM